MLNLAVGWWLLIVFDTLPGYDGRNFTYSQFPGNTLDRLGDQSASLRQGCQPIFGTASPLPRANAVVCHSVPGYLGVVRTLPVRNKMGKITAALIGATPLFVLSVLGYAGVFGAFVFNEINPDLMPAASVLSSEGPPP